MSTQNWIIDTVHSDITFRVKHMMITTVSGTFDRFSGTMTNKSADFTDAKITFEADTDSVNTRNDQRDAHLKSEEFFNTAKFPKIGFTSTSMKKISGNSYELHGTFNMTGRTQPLVLKAEYLGKVVDPWGQTRVGFELSGSIMRSLFGMLWNAATEDGGVVVSEEVRLSMNIQMLLQA
jgi:polyisoprenoid-binding protein YceI